MMMSYVGSKSSNVVPPEYFCPVVAPMHDEAWNIEWGSIRPLNDGVGTWHQVQNFRAPFRTAQQQFSFVSNDAEAHYDEDNYELHLTASAELEPGDLPSIGSKDHASGECKRCAFFSKGRCKNGKDCSHCHYPHEERKRRNRRNKKGNASQVDEDAEYEEEDANAEIVDFTETAFLCMPVSDEGSDDTLTLEPVTQEPVTQDLHHVQNCDAISSSKKVTSEESCDAPAEGFSCLLSGNEKPTEPMETNVNQKPMEVKAEDSVADTKEVGRPTSKMSGVKGKKSSKSSRAQLLAFALGAPPTMNEDDAESVDATKIESIESCIPAPKVSDDGIVDVVKIESACADLQALEAEAMRLEAEALAAETEAQRLLEESTSGTSDCISPWLACRHQRLVEKSLAEAMISDAKLDKKKTMDREAETTASSADSDGGATERDSSSADKADQTSSSSDSDVASDKDSSHGLSQELSTCRPERKQSKTKRQVPGVTTSTRAPKRSPLWPSRAPTMSPAAPSVSPSEGEPKKEKKSWSAMAHARREVASEDSEVAVMRQARGILNKLTDANFERLYTQLVECGIQSATQLEAVIMEIFEKATTQHGFLPMYVELCIRLNSHFESQPVEGADFRKLLVAACQRTFEQNIRTQPQVDANLSYEDRVEVELRFKTRMLGNLRFVGELLVRKLLAGKILLAVSEELLSVGDGASIEAAATLLTVAGHAFDRKSWVFLPRLHAMFTMMRCMSKDKAIPMRVRCILKDLIDLREAGWQKK
jgi:hypothetical protein